MGPAVVVRPSQPPRRQRPPEPSRPSGPHPLSALLRPAAARRTLVRPADVGGPAAWQALVRDGVLVRVRHDVAAPSWLPLTPEVRALALAPAVPARAVVTGVTAAWVHCGAADGEALHLAYVPGTHRPPAWSGARVWSAPGIVGDCRPVAGVRVATPVRTAVDVALHLPPDDAVPVLVALAHAGVDLTAAARALELRLRAVGRPRARTTLAAAHRALTAPGPPAAHPPAAHPPAAHPPAAHPPAAHRPAAH
ncbi:hypothetical protein [Puerhibacterium sp. TATVAM-FAB25]|uniref:hypothetical protein n=1 Tax=Puerhibacterium sp. TATVAM-FAB25 TaxID=3093699 RepID=UPI00397B2E60